MNFFPNLKGQKQRMWAISSKWFYVDPLKKNILYALLCRGEKETSPNALTSMLNVFSTDIYVLLDSAATFSFVTHLVAKKFDIFLDILNEPFMEFTPWVSQLVLRKYIEISL